MHRWNHILVCKTKLRTQILLTKESTSRQRLNGYSRMSVIAVSTNDKDTCQQRPGARDYSQSDSWISSEVTDPSTSFTLYDKLSNLWLILFYRGPFNVTLVSMNCGIELESTAEDWRTLSETFQGSKSQSEVKFSSNRQFRNLCWRLKSEASFHNSWHQVFLSILIQNTANGWNCSSEKFSKLSTPSRDKWVLVGDFVRFHFQIKNPHCQNICKFWTNAFARACLTRSHLRNWP